MQPLTGAVQTIPPRPHLRPLSSNQLQQIVYQNLVQNTQAFPGFAWQANVPISDRLIQILNLISNPVSTTRSGEFIRNVDPSCAVERELFHNSPSKEVYEREMTKKITESSTKRPAIDRNLQNTSTSTANAQAEAQARTRLQAMANKYEGSGHSRRFPTERDRERVLQASMREDEERKERELRDPQPDSRGLPMPRVIGIEMAHRLFPDGLAMLSTDDDKRQVVRLANRMMANASETIKANTRHQLQHRLPPQKLAEFQALGMDPLMWFYQSQAFQTIKANAQKRTEAQTPYPLQAATMQQPRQQKLAQLKTPGAVSSWGRHLFTNTRTRASSLSSAPISYTISQDHTAGEQARRADLLADLGRKRRLGS
ncbi:hypothetical protein B0T10DRAFT_547278 [Thelonectria olida]|uniref:Uncharacterized protein n=1 Tax=Thelonectria olida TaxID=1576542 RepID=A0A9P8W8G3_9HYPO|nr:hypothetical protein B0T10DRAFT_547278 [Thelonectria olida]